MSRTSFRKQIAGMSDAEAKDYLLDVLDEIFPAQEIWDFPGIHLTRDQKRIVKRLARVPGAPVTREALHASVYFDRMSDDQPEIKILDVQISKARRQLRKVGIEIITIWGEGYRLEVQPGYRFPWEPPEPAEAPAEDVSARVACLRAAVAEAGVYPVAKLLEIRPARLCEIIGADHA